MKVNIYLYTVLEDPTATVQAPHNVLNSNCSLLDLQLHNRCKLRCKRRSSSFPELSTLAIGNLMLPTYDVSCEAE